MVRTIVLLSKISPCGGVTQRVHGVVEARAAPFASDVSPSNAIVLRDSSPKKRVGMVVNFRVAADDVKVVGKKRHQYQIS